MIPFLTYPLAMLALATLPALAAIYILRNRFRRRQVSSLLLWRFHVQSKQGGAKVHRLQLPLLFFLELLALALLVTAAAGPHWKLPQSTRPLIIVLDDSFSMRAIHDGISSQTRAHDFLEKLFRHQPPPSTRLILAQNNPLSLGSAVKTWSQVDELLREWNCHSPGAAIPAAITLASELGQQQANILVLTDHKPNDEKISNPRLEWHAFGAPLDNFAIVNAARTALGEQDRCLLEIANFSDAERTTKLLVQAGSNTVRLARAKISGSFSTFLRPRQPCTQRSRMTRWPTTTKFNCCRPFANACACKSLWPTKILPRWRIALWMRPVCARQFRTILNWSSVKPIRPRAATFGICAGFWPARRMPSPARLSWTRRIRSRTASPSRARSGRARR
jgi:hypothetical protein